MGVCGCEFGKPRKKENGSEVTFSYPSREEQDNGEDLYREEIEEKRKREEEKRKRFIEEDKRKREEEKRKRFIEEENRKKEEEKRKREEENRKEEVEFRKNQIELESRKRRQKEEEENYRKKQIEIDNKIKKQKEEEDNYRKKEIKLNQIKNRQKEEEKNIKNYFINPELVSISDINEIKQLNIIEEKKSQEKKESIKFYDMVIDFSSFEQLKNEGWVALFSEKGKDKYEKCKKENNITIGIIGNKNRGKSFLLGRIIGKKNYQNPNGFLITTQGISANFPILEDTDQVFITLDTAGKDNPLLESPIFNDKEKDKEFIKKIARDQKVTEIVLADFIIQESDILITVLEQLSFAEQDMLKNLLNQLKEKKIEGINRRKLIVIHNLMNISEVEGIQSFISNILKKSLTFLLTEQFMSDFKDESQNIDDSKKLIYVQITNDIDKLEIVHLVIGNDNIPEIRKEYNEPAFRYIRKAIKIATQRKFDLINSFKNFIITNSQKYLNGEGLGKDSLKIDESKYKEKKTISIKLDDNKKSKIDLKGVIVDSKGIHNFLPSIEPRYTTRIIEKDNNKLFIEIEFEMFGKLNEQIKTKISIDKNQYLITINGSVEEIGKSNENSIKSDNSKCIKGNLKYSEFYFQVIIEKYIPFKNKEGKVEEKKEYNITKILNQQNPDKIEDKKYGIYKLLYPVEYCIIDNSDDDSKSEN